MGKMSGKATRCLGAMLLLLAALLTGSCEKKEAQQVPAAPRPEIAVTQVDEALTDEHDGKNNKDKAPAPFYTSYVVNLEVNPPQRKINGIEKITYRNQTKLAMDNIVLKNNIAAFSNGYEPQPFFDEFVMKVYKYGRSYSEMAINSLTINSENVSYEMDGRNIIIHLATPLPPDASIDITMQFEAVVPKICHRMGANNKAIWLGNFLPKVAANVNGSFVMDQYYPAGDPFVNEMCNYDVTISTPKEYSVFGTGLEKITENETNKTTNMNVNMVRDFAFVVGNDFKSEKITTDSGVTINFHYYSNYFTSKTKLLDLAKQSVDYFSDRVGAYPYQELDIIETELNYSGGMEFPAVIFLDSTYLNENDDGFESVAHEIGHQWFYSVVGSNQIKEPWMDEGIVTYLQNRMLHESAEVDEIMNAWYRELGETLKYSEIYSLLDDLSVYTEWSQYYDINYRRAALMFHGLYRKMGTAKFNSFLKAYYTENSFKLASKKNLVDCASEIYGERLDDYFESWMAWREFPNL